METIGGYGRVRRFHPNGRDRRLPGSQQPVEGSAQPATTPQPAPAQLDKARKAMEQGNWAAFGTAMEGLEHQLAAPAAPGFLSYRNSPVL